MTVTESRQLIDTFAEYLESLRHYAKKVMVQGYTLTQSEELDKKAKVDLLFAIGRAFKLTENEMVSLVLEGTQARTRRCGCPTCRSRGGYGGV